ncbi:MAG TPA: VWA domain-containing protein [Bryobacteraceae bacterium]|nr:VWA domain-containing protein [Bryobacteraceae bacterium]
MPVRPKWVGLAVATAFLAAAQSDEVRVSAHNYVPPPLRLTVETQLVEMDVTVRDSRGQAVSGLRQGDFEILDEGKPREIAAFLAETRGKAVLPSVAAASAAAPAAPAPAQVALPSLPVRSTLLFFDDLHASPAELQRAQLAARQFVKAGLGAGAQAAVYSSSAGLSLAFTPDTEALGAAIGKLHTHQRLSENGLMPCPRITPYQAYLIFRNDLDALNAAVQEAQQCLNADTSLPQVQGRRSSLTSVNPKANAGNTNLIAVQQQANSTWEKAREDSLDSIDAVDKALELLSQAPGTRVLLMASTGFLTGMMESGKAEAIDRAIRAGIVINALDAKGLWSEAPGRNAGTVGALPAATFFFETSTIGSRNDALNEVMQEFASATGGLFFHNSNDLAGGFSQLGSAPETTYEIAFHPGADSLAGQFHKLQVRLTTRNSDYVQARPGYITPPPPAETKAESRPIDQHVTGSEALAQFPVQLMPTLSKNAKGETVVSLTIHVDLAALQFARENERYVQKLTFIGALIDSGDKLVAAKEGSMDFALKPDTMTRLAASGVNARLALSAPAGTYRARAVVMDAERKLASVNRNVEIPK